MPSPTKDLKNLIEHQVPPIYKLDDQTTINFPLFPAIVVITAIGGGVYSFFRVACGWCVDYRKAITKVNDIEASLNSVKAEQTKEFAAIKESIANIKTSMMLSGQSSELLEKQFEQIKTVLTDKISKLQEHEIDRARLEAKINFIQQELSEQEAEIKNIRINLKQ